MKKLPEWIISRRQVILGIMLIITALCGLLALRVRINYDMSKYLPDHSPMSIGMRIMEEEFPPMDMGQTIRVMSEGLDAEEEKRLQRELEEIPFVRSVAHDGSAAYSRDGYSLFVLTTDYAYGSPEEKSIEKALQSGFGDFGIVFQNDNNGVYKVPFMLLAVAVGMLVVILVIMCDYWGEAILFLANIGFAILINLGTNLVLGEISFLTWTMASILQLVLSMDYSIMLSSRYRQEKEKGLANADAMAAAIRNCFSSVAGSAFTTAVGMLALCFMQFKIGRDLGIVLAKGVLISLLCVFTMLPGMLLFFDGIIEKTKKKALHIPLGRVSRFSCRFRFLLTGLFVVLFIGFFVLQSRTPISYNLEDPDPIAEVFTPENLLVMVYENRDEEKIAEMCRTLDDWEGIDQVLAYPHLPVRGIGGLFGILEGVLPSGAGQALQRAQESVEEGMRMLKTDRYSRMILRTSLPVESEATTALMEYLSGQGDLLEGEYYLVGHSAMSHEMRQSFAVELRNITLLTAAAIFLIVLLSTRSLFVSAILVLIVQCGVFLTVTVVGWQGYRIYYMALVIVECILMGATIDYGILFSGYYREKRRTLPVQEALDAAYEGSIHTILTSGLIITIVTGVLGYTYSDPTVAEICRTISTGALSAILLILFLLPGMLAVLDPFIQKK